MLNPVAHVRRNRSIDGPIQFSGEKLPEIAEKCCDAYKTDDEDCTVPDPTTKTSPS